MMYSARWTLALVMMMTLLSGVTAQEINLPAKADVKVGAESIIFVNKITAKDVQYKVYGEGKCEVVPEPLGDPSVLLFKVKAQSAGKYTLVVAGALGDKLIVRECLITAVADVSPVVPPQPADLTKVLDKLAELEARVAALEKKPPTPNPPPDTIKIARHVTFVGPELTAPAVAINNDAELRANLKSAGISVHVLRSGDPQIKAKGLEPYVTESGPPTVIIQDETGAVISSGPMTSKEQVRTLIFAHVRR